MPSKNRALGISRLTDEVSWTWYRVPMSPIRSLIDELDSQTAVVTLAGSLTLGSNLTGLDAQLRTMVEKGVRRVVIDLTEVSYIDSSGLGLMVRTHELLRKAGGTMRFCGVSAGAAELFALTTTDAFLAFDADRAASLLALEGGQV